ncbi:4'-phosphopantetheinyl transferase family protein [Streptomyces iconiensis]|uniref:4'-phosphopantetheinyl transferase superfamily protein n=1 Tax=Streptomyces iconiensis TaxID=1384038 RepID=A0ABT7A0W7_9ACTN|nr:4'-phosphopantetheinyl transferase superfamily protein [Streptomyces iconiensis]MDJ1134975.1 4'-phosphopantetheinyl transferase superfamily protein [Streptomyces iconiensis]
MSGNGFLDVWPLVLPPPERLGQLLGTARLDASALDARERARASSFSRPGDAARYTAAHVALRRILGGYLALAPARVTFFREPCPGCGERHGRPAVAHRGPPLHFSLSHSGERVLVAVASETVGVDVQRRPGPGTVEICARLLHPGERAELEACELPARRRAFGRIWARKEAFLKALGTGLRRDPAADYLGADPERRPGPWSVRDIGCGPGHDAAVAFPATLAAPRTVVRLSEDVLTTEWRRRSSVPMSGGAVSRGRR